MWQRNRHRIKHDPDFMERISRDLEACKTACKLLEVEESVSEEELKKTFRRTAVAYHPDHMGNTEDVFCGLCDAFEALKPLRPAIGSRLTRSRDPRWAVAAAGESRQVPDQWQSGRPWAVDAVTFQAHC